MKQQNDNLSGPTNNKLVAYLVDTDLPTELDPLRARFEVSIRPSIHPHQRTSPYTFLLISPLLLV